MPTPIEALDSFERLQVNEVERNVITLRGALMLGVEYFPGMDIGASRATYRIGESGDDVSHLEITLKPGEAPLLKVILGNHRHVARTGPFNRILVAPGAQDDDIDVWTQLDGGFWKPIKECSDRSWYPQAMGGLLLDKARKFRTEATI